MAKIEFHNFSIVRRTLLAYIFILAVLLKLGLWQLERAEEKENLLVLQAQAGSEVVNLTLKKLDHADDLLYKQIRLQGHYDANHQFLLDNQIEHGKAGYFVLTPFIIENSSQAVLINRGWVKQGLDRRVFPNVDFLPITHRVEGRLSPFPSVGIKLAGAEIPSEGWPALIQIVDSRVLSDKLGYKLLNNQLQLAPQATDGYVRNWQKPNQLPPEKHRAYAGQWFLLALTLTILFAKYGIARRDYATEN